VAESFYTIYLHVISILIASRVLGWWCFLCLALVLEFDVGTGFAVVFLGELRDALHGGGEALLAELPVSWAHLLLAVSDRFLMEDEGVQHTEDLIQIAANRVGVLVLDENLTLLVQQEHAANDILLIGLEHVVGSGDLLGGIGQQRVVDGSNATQTAVQQFPALVGVNGVTGATPDDAISRFELLQELVEARDLRSADESEIGRVEEKDHILATEGGQGYCGETVVWHAAVEGKVGGFLSNEHDEIV